MEYIKDFLYFMMIRTERKRIINHKFRNIEIYYVSGRVPFHSLLFPLATRTRPHHIFPFPFLCGDNGFWFYFLFESFYLTKPIIIIYFSFPILRLWSLSLPPNNLRERDLIITGRLRLTEELRDEAWSGRGERVTWELFHLFLYHLLSVPWV